MSCIIESVKYEAESDKLSSRITHQNRTVVVGQFILQSILSPEIHGSTPTIIKISAQIQSTNYEVKTKVRKLESG